MTIRRTDIFFFFKFVDITSKRAIYFLEKLRFQVTAQSFHFLFKFEQEL